MSVSRMSAVALFLIAGASAQGGDTPVSASGAFTFVDDGFGAGSALEGLAVADTFSLDLSVVAYEEVFDEPRGGGEMRRFRGTVGPEADFLIFALAASGAPVNFNTTEGNLGFIAEFTNDVDFGAGLRDEVVLVTTFDVEESDPPRGSSSFRLEVFASFPSDTWDTIDPTRAINLDDAIFSGATFRDSESRAAFANSLTTFTTPGPSAMGALVVLGVGGARRRRR